MPRNTNDDDSSLGTENKLTTILIHVGETRKGIQRLENDIQEVKDSMSDLRSSTVRREECNGKHLAISQGVVEIRTDIRNLKKGITGDHYPVVPPTNPNMNMGGFGHAAGQSAAHVASAQAMLSGNSGMMLAPTMDTAVEEVLDKRSEKTRKSLTFWFATISAVIGIMSSLGFAAFKFTQYISKVDNLIVKSNAELDKEKEQQKVEPRIVYIKVPVQVDAGSAPLPVKKKPRR